MNLSGPDVPAIQCHIPDGCCGPSPCDMSEVQFICQVRSLLPEGELWNATLPTVAPETAGPAQGAQTVGCYTVGCEQLIFGSCCEDAAIQCDEEQVAPQIALIDSFAAGTFGVIRALCAMMRELDPCTSDITLHQWGHRFGLVSDDLCGPQWSDQTLRTLLCILQQIRGRVMNWAFFEELAARFGARLNIHAPGDFSDCGPAGWWTMARDINVTGLCDRAPACPPEAEPEVVPWIRLVPTCLQPPESLNLVIGRADITPPDNCNLPSTGQQPHDEELFNAFLWLLPKLLPPQIIWCIYAEDIPNCII